MLRIGGDLCGLILGVLLARTGFDVVEKHDDFRGDTIHPQQSRVMFELGLLDEFLALSHSAGTWSLSASAAGACGLSSPAHARKFLALLRQWHFLNFLAERGKACPTFHLRMHAQMVALIEEPACAPKRRIARST